MKKKCCLFIFLILFFILISSFAYSVEMPKAIETAKNLEPIVTSVLEQNNEDVHYFFRHFIVISGFFVDEKPISEIYQSMKIEQQNYLKEGLDKSFIKQCSLLIEKFDNLNLKQTEFLQQNLKKYFVVIEEAVPDFKHLKNKGVAFLKLFINEYYNGDNAKKNNINNFLNSFYNEKLMIKKDKLDLKNYCFIINSASEMSTIKTYYNALQRNKIDPNSLISKEFNRLKYTHKLDEIGNDMPKRDNIKDKDVIVAKMNRCVLESIVQQYNAKEKEKILSIDEKSMDNLITKGYIDSKQKQEWLNSIEILK